MMRIGQGFDVHPFAPGRKLILGGVHIPHDRGLAGHSDADALLHAICDACLGAAGLGDIGQHFPDTDAQYKDIDSRILLRRVQASVSAAGWQVGNIDATIIAQAPSLAEYLAQMQDNISRDLKIPAGQINVKATTTERLGFAGRSEGIAALAAVLLLKSQ
jgi:2-C-methyl-D-erythritol 2,4-cyclodiphosphate synthase